MKKKDLKVIREIQAKAWAKYGDKLFVEKPESPVLNDLLDKALSEKDIKLTDVQRDRLQTMKDTQAFERTVKKEDPKIAEKMSNYVQKEIGEKIKSGELNDPTKDEYYVKKAKQLANRKGRED